MPSEFRRSGWDAASIKVLRRSHGHSSRSADAARDQGWVRQVADPNGEIQPFAHQIDDGIVHHQLDLDIRVPIEERGHPWCDVQAAECHGRSQAKQSARLSSAAAHDA